MGYKEKLSKRQAIQETLVHCSCTKHGWSLWMSVTYPKKSGSSRTIAVKILTARKAVAIQEEKWCHSKGFVANMLPIKRKVMAC